VYILSTLYYPWVCNETLTKYFILQAQIKEEEHDFQRRIGSVRESLLQQVKPNIKQIDDHRKAGEVLLFKCIQSISISY
jgi:hypothetical protein